MTDRLYRADQLVEATLSLKRPIAFLVGAPLSAPTAPEAKGVPGTNELIEMALQRLSSLNREALEAKLRSTPTPDRYSTALQELHASRGQDEVNTLVRDAVLRACVSTDRADQEDPLDWTLPPATAALGEILSAHGGRFGPTLTTNFDPLLTIAVKRAGGRAHRLVIPEDGGLDQSQVPSDHATIIHLHGFWQGSDTLHTASQLRAERPKLRASLQRLLRTHALVVVAYGGWDDVVTTALKEHAIADAADGDILWAFFDNDHDRILSEHSTLLSQLNAPIARGRLRLYGGVDCHSYFQELLSSLRQDRHRATSQFPRLVAPRNEHVGLADNPSSFVEQLYQMFGVRWEPASATKKIARVFWPVRLRPPTVIHAAQAFLAAGLQRRGVEVTLCLDDLGRSECSPDRFQERIAKHFERVGTPWSNVSVVLASTVVSAERLGDTWMILANWLASDGNSLQRVLKACKLASGSGEIGLGRKPRKLMTPAVVWSCLHWDLDQRPLSPQDSTVTLGGQDEIAQWDAWRAVFGHTRRVGHVYVPKLAALSTKGQGPLVMAEEEGLYWASGEDIESTLAQDGSPPSHTSNLLGWMISQCLVLPASLQGKTVTLCGVPITHPSDLQQLDGLSRNDVVRAVIQQASEALL